MIRRGTLARFWRAFVHKISTINAPPSLSYQDGRPLSGRDCFLITTGARVRSDVGLTLHRRRCPRLTTCPILLVACLARKSAQTRLGSGAFPLWSQSPLAYVVTPREQCADGHYHDYRGPIHDFPAVIKMTTSTMPNTMPHIKITVPGITAAPVITGLQSRAALRTKKQTGTQFRLPK